MAVLAHYGLVCSSCSESRIGALQIDHINGGGRQHLQQLSNADTIALYLHQQFRETGAYPLGYQTLCANCNTKKHAIGITPPSTPNAIRNKRYRDRVKRTFMDLLGARCACGQSDMDVLTAGHPNGDGADHRREVSDGKAGFFFYHALLKSPDLTGRTIICQCFSCNCDEAYG